MRLQGDANNLHGMEVDNHVYLLIKKLAFWQQGLLTEEPAVEMNKGNELSIAPYFCIVTIYYQ